MQRQNNEFGQLIRSHRISCRLSLRDVAKELDVVFTTVRAWERGTHWPRLDHATQIAKLYGMSLDKVMGINNG